MDGSDPVTVSVSDDGSGVYTVKAPKGFNKGCSYELTLADGWIFDGKDESIRTAAFSIAKEAVDNISFSPANHYVRNINPAALHAGSQVSCEGVNVGDLICFYKNVNPKDRDYKSGEAYLDDPETWFKASAVSGSTVTLTELESADSKKCMTFRITSRLSEVFPQETEVLSPWRPTMTVTLLILRHML